MAHPALIGGRDRLRAGDHFRRRLVEPFDQGLHLGAAHESSSISILAPSAMSCGSCMASAKALRTPAPARIEARRRHHRAAHGLAGENHVQHLAVVGFVTNSLTSGTSGSSLCFSSASCMTILSLPRREFALVAGAGDAPGIADDAVELATLDRQHDFLGAGIAGDRLQPGAKQRIQGDRERVLVAADAGRAHLQRRARKISFRFAAGGFCRMKKPDTSLFMLPSQANLVESNLACEAVPPEQRFHRDATADDGDLGAVLGCGVVKIVCEIERARARPVLRHDGGIAGEIFSDVARHSRP